MSRYAIAALAIGATVLTNTAWQIRSVLREFESEVQATNRLVDIGVNLHVVRREPGNSDPAPGRPELRRLRTHRLGGILDTKLDVPRILRVSENPVNWYCSEDQEPVIFHRDSDPLGQLVYGSMGAGKTTCGVIWLYARWLEAIAYGRSGCEGGITAPNETRLSLVMHELLKMFPPAWRSFRSSDNIVTLCDRTRLRGVSTYLQSAAQGSRIQGFTWGFGVLSDEMQDQVEEAANIDARCRGGRVIVEKGNEINCVKQLRTATAKDTPEWRTLRDQSEAAKDINGKHLWIRRTLFGKRSPFVPAAHWIALRATMSEREYARNVEARDVGPERATYPAWSREHNLITVPDIGWTNVTQYENRGAGPNFTLQAGHDPGTLVDVSLFGRAFVKAGDEQKYHRGLVEPFWVVLGELNTEESTTEYHIGRFLETVRDRWQLNLLDRHGRTTREMNQVLVRCDPAGTTDNRTHKSVYTQFANAQVMCKPAAYNAEGDGHGKVPKDPGIEMVNTLFCNAAGVRRLFVARNADGSPAAPRLVAALESSVRDTDGKAEKQPKNKNDVSHWPASLRYMLWAIERPRLKRMAGVEA